MPADGSEVLRVSGNFPRVPKSCKNVAEPFFKCLHTNGKQPEGASDPDAGTKAMVKCAQQLKEYNECVDAFFAKKPKKIFRVPEAYRVRDD